MERLSSSRRERGVVLILTLIVLLILTIGAVALVRSMNTSQVSAGNLAFRHDLVNQGEQALSTVLQSFQSGALASGTTDNVATANYSAKTLDSNAQGIPSVLLLSDSGFAGAGMKAADLTGATSDVKIRYVIERMCNSTGPATGSACVQSVANPNNTDSNQIGGIPPPSATVYRLSVRVTGPRNTQIFLQSSFSIPDSQ
jgi:Tfp pilus assembly protein PilX